MTSPGLSGEHQGAPAPGFVTIYLWRSLPEAQRTDGRDYVRWQRDPEPGQHQYQGPTVQDLMDY